MTKLVLLTREKSSMASSWNVHLCLEELQSGQFQLSTCMHEILGSIYDLVDEEDCYDDAGELRVPESWDGVEVIGLSDGEYLETATLIAESTSSMFDASSTQTAMAFCEQEGWTTAEDFPASWQRALAIVAGADAGGRVP